ncbi:hypothetical protein SteCoe_36171 [Stentor coeruleus]|uniref:Uncharacterized protein n=1 Tax=Stentor coeruleus TaxID=5963 RepID=A0A1R2AQQ2_9CILI|nr:hypothetical protein SteCoe_36171 [Stentor coeruleus]
MDEVSQIVNPDLVKLAQELVLDEHFPCIPIWLSTATKNEIKGLKVVNAIVKHEGRKKFRPKQIPTESLLQNSADLLRKKYMKSNYEAEYCQESQNNQQVDILKYRQLNELKCTEVLKKLPLAYLKNWLTLKDEPNYQYLMLTFLRGIYSVAKTQTAIPSSSHREYFSWVKNDNTRRNGLASKSVDRKNTQKSSSKRTESFSEAKYHYESPKYAEISHRTRGIQALKGNGEITSWVSHLQGVKTSLYQDSFIPLFAKKIIAPKADFNTSIVCRLLPNNDNKL